MKNGPKFDTNDGDFIFGDDNLGFDSQGHMMIGFGNNIKMDMKTGNVHLTTGGLDDCPNNANNNIWDDEDDD